MKDFGTLAALKERPTTHASGPAKTGAISFQTRAGMPSLPRAEVDFILFMILKISFSDGCVNFSSSEGGR